MLAFGCVLSRPDNARCAVSLARSQSSLPGPWTLPSMEQSSLSFSHRQLWSARFYSWARKFYRCLCSAYGTHPRLDTSRFSPETRNLSSSERTISVNGDYCRNQRPDLSMESVLRWCCEFLDVLRPADPEPDSLADSG